jgi:hypothetical protein
MFKLDRAHIKMSTLITIKDQLGFSVRDFLYYKKRCGTNVASLQPIDYNKHTENMIEDNESEKQIRLVLSQQEETSKQVSITPLKRPWHQLDEDDHPFMDDALDAYKKWLKKLPKEKSKSISFVLYICSLYHLFYVPNMLLLTNRIEG